MQIAIHSRRFNLIVVFGEQEEGEEEEEFLSNVDGDFSPACEGCDDCPQAFGFRSTSQGE